MNDIKAATRQQLEEARKLRDHIESEKVRTRADLARKLEQVDATFAPRLENAARAVEAFEAILDTFPADNVLALSPALIHAPSLQMRPTVKLVFEESDSTPMRLDEISERVKSKGVATTAKNFTQAVRAAIYGLIEAEEPIRRVGEGTWVYDASDDQRKGWKRFAADA